MHGLIVGMTESGKSTLAKKFAAGFKNQGSGVIVYDPLNYNDWGADFISDNIFDVLNVAKSSRDCYIFIDEASNVCGVNDKHSHWLATQSRHYGHTAFFIGQRLTMMAPNIRTNCGALMLFNSSLQDCKILTEDFNERKILTANELKKGEYFYIRRFHPVRKMRVF